MNLLGPILGAGIGALSGNLIAGRTGTWAGAVVGGLFGVWVFWGSDEEEGDYMAGPTGTGRSSDDALLNTLEPVTRELTVAFLLAARAAGHDIYLVSALRSYTKQKELYDAYIARGKTGLPASNPDTNPSSHLFGAGIDVGYLDARGKPIQSALVPIERWRALAKIGESVGLKAGLNFLSKSDKVHFERPDWRTLRDAAESNA